MNHTDQFVEKIIRSMEEYKMIAQGERVIAGVSGGADSVCLLAVLREYQTRCSFSLSVVHVEHGLRGADSLEDAEFVERLCGRWDIPCRTVHADVKRYAGEQGMTLEEAGRKLRYEAFEQCRKEWQADKIAVAHNQNDQAETVLLNLARGSGVKGLGGIRPVRGNVIRPLLFVSRDEIEQWLRSRAMDWRTDATNQETEYTRNRIRLQILPLLEQGVNGSAVGHMAASALRLQQAEDYLQRQAQEKYDLWVREEGGRLLLSLGGFRDAQPLMQEYVLRLCVERILEERGLKDYTTGHIEDMKRLAGMDCGKRMDFPGGLQAVRERELLCFSRAGYKKDSFAGPEKVYIPGDGIYEIGGRHFQVTYLDHSKKPESFPEKKCTKWLAYDTIKDKVCLRTRQSGDYLVVDRQGGRKKLKDYMIDRKIPREERDSVLLAAQGSHILWVVGYRISEAAKITDETETMIKIQMMEEEV